MPRLLERHRPKRVLCVGMFGFATATLLLGLTSRLPSAAAFALAASALRMAEGGLGAVCEVVVNALLITHNPVGEISTVMGRLMVVRSLGMAAGLKRGRPFLRIAHHEPPWLLWRLSLGLSNPKRRLCSSEAKEAS